MHSRMRVIRCCAPCPSPSITIVAATYARSINRAAVDERFTIEAEDAVLICDGRPEADDWLVFTHREDFDVAGDRVPDADGVAEVPVDIEEDAACARQIVRDDRVEDASDH